MTAHDAFAQSILPDVFVSCPVSEEPPPTDFDIQQRWATPDVAGQRTLPYQTPVVGDLFDNGQPVVVVGADNSFQGGVVSDRLAKDLHIVNGLDGTIMNTIVTPHFNWSGHAVVAIADVTGDGQGEIILKASQHTSVPLNMRGRLIAYENDGTQLWISDERYDYAETQGRGGASLGIADFNGDGVPEAYVGNQIFNARTGARLVSATSAASAGCSNKVSNGCFFSQVTAVDMDGDGQLELVAGDVVYNVNITDTTGEAGNSLTIWQQADPTVSGVGDGYTAVADINLDGTPDVIVVRTADAMANGDTRIYVWDGQTSAVEDVLSGVGTRGGPPLIGDIDGDGSPEIVVQNSGALRAFDFEAGGLVSKWTLTTNDVSGVTSLSMFDFNNDGRMELVYRDQTDLRIIDGSGTTANDFVTIPCTSGTATDMPVIAALDGSREARILVNCGTISSSQGQLRAFETASFPWANTRPVWNQQAYFVSHVNNDLSIPSDQFPHWESFEDPEQQCSDGTNRPLNAFQQQVTDLDENTGCPVICTPFEMNMTVGPCWRMLSSPVGVTYADMLENIWTQGVPGADYVGGTPNVLLWDNTATGNTGGWIPPASLNDSIPPGTGFLVSVYADDDYDGVDDPFPKTLSVSGPAHTGDITPPMNTTDGGWTLVGNPYIQPVDFNSLTTTDLTGVGYVWDRNTGNWASTTSDGFGDVTDGAFVPGQGFFVQNTDPAGSPSITFTEGSRTTGGEFYGKQRELRDYLRLEVQGESLYNSMWIRFSEKGSVEPAYGDALELQPLSEQYALLGARKTDGTLVDIGHFPLPDETLQIPVHVDATRPGSYTITATDLDIPAGLSSEASAQAGAELYLNDLDTGETVAITESFEYTFTINQAAAKSTPDQGMTPCSASPEKAKAAGQDRFMITTSAGGPAGELPNEVALGQNYPNPFNPSTQITYELPAASEVHLEVFDMLGRRVATLVEGTVQAGVHQVTFDAAHLTSGVYIYRLTATTPQGGQQVFTRKLTLIK